MTVGDNQNIFFIIFVVYYLKQKLKTYLSVRFWVKWCMYKGIMQYYIDML